VSEGEIPIARSQEHEEAGNKDGFKKMEEGTIGGRGTREHSKSLTNTSSTRRRD